MDEILPPDDGSAEFPDDAEIVQPPPTIESLLHPKSPMHSKVLSRLKSRIELSKRITQELKDSWDQVDERRGLYYNLARPAKKGDKTVQPGKLEMPFERGIVMPMSYAIHETRKAEIMSSYLFRSPFTQLDGRGPEDVKGAKVAEVKLEYDYQESDGPLAVYQVVADADAYGVGIIHDHWEDEKGWQTIRPDPIAMEYAQLTGQPPPEPTQQWGSIKQYTKWSNVDPYLAIPDPRVSRARLQDGEFFGHETFRSYLWLRERDQAHGGMYFNLEELKKQGSSESGASGETRVSPRGRGAMDISQFQLRGSTDEKDKGYFTIANIQVKLIPKDWELGEEDTPQIWWFSVADEKVIIRAHKTPHDHGKFTYAAGEVGLDMHRNANPGTMELLDGVQRVNDWLVNSRIDNVRKFLNDMLAFSPELIEEDDVMSPGTARWIRTTAAGTKFVMQGGDINKAFQQIQIQDVTGTHFEISQYLMDMANKLGAANDTMQGMTLPDKRTLGEINNAVSAGSKRITVTARILDAMVFKALAMRAVQNAQQFYEIDQWVRVTGDYSELDPDSLGRIMVSKADLAGDFDYVPTSALTPQDPARMMGVWNALLQIANTMPQLSMPDPLDPTVLDTKSLFKMVARMGGAREVDTMFKALPQIAATGAPPGVMPDEQVQQGVQAGNLVPVEGTSGGVLGQ